MIMLNMLAMGISLICTIVLISSRAAWWAIGINLAAFLFNAGIVLFKVFSIS